MNDLIGGAVRWRDAPLTRVSSTHLMLNVDIDGMVYAKNLHHSPPRPTFKNIPNLLSVKCNWFYRSRWNIRSTQTIFANWFIKIAFGVRLNNEPRRKRCISRLSALYRVDNQKPLSSILGIEPETCVVSVRCVYFAEVEEMQF